MQSHTELQRGDRVELQRDARAPWARQFEGGTGGWVVEVRPPLAWVKFKWSAQPVPVDVTDLRRETP